MEKLLMELLELSHKVYVNNQLKEVIENIYDRYKDKSKFNEDNLSEFLMLCKEHGITPDFFELKNMYLDAKINSQIKTKLKL